MNGPQHYAQAERDLSGSYEAHPEHAMYLLARAQVHATLAHVAALAERTVHEWVHEGDNDAQAWADVLFDKPVKP